MEQLAREGNLSAYKHRAYWQNMDSLRDKIVLEGQWESGSPAWKIW
jgi:glucose-1-phosphate cytidylyltransferase